MPQGRYGQRFLGRCLCPSPLPPPQRWMLMVPRRGSEGRSLAAPLKKDGSEWLPRTAQLEGAKSYSRNI